MEISMAKLIALIKALGGGGGGGGGGVEDVKLNDVSVVEDGVAKIKTNENYGTSVYNKQLIVQLAGTEQIKTGSQYYRPIVPHNQHQSTFYGLAKAAGDSTQSASSNAVGTYTETAKSAISQMLSAPETVSVSTPSITAKPGVQYVCGEVSTLSITVPATGCVDIIFVSGSTPTVLSLPTGQDKISWADGWDETCEANTTYELNILNGKLGVKGQWT